MRITLFSTLIATLVLASWSVKAQGTEDALIEKFSHVYLQLAPTDPAKSGVTLRLADLLAERARKKSIEDVAKGESDRRQAIRYYQEAVGRASEAVQPRIWIQMGHLFELNGESDGAVKAYSQVLASQTAASEQVADANLSLGEVFFRKRDFSKARDHFAKVLASPKAPSRGLASYRTAWCFFNEGEVEKGIESLIAILNTPDLLKRSSVQNASIDAQFQEEVSRDLATFMAKRKVQTEDLEKLYKLSPESAKIGNLVYLAGEAERLGQTQEALRLWRFVLDKQAQPRDRLESQIHIAQLEISQQNYPSALAHFEGSLQLWATIGCSDEGCKELKTRLKNIVVDWNKAQSKKPTDELLKGYQAYSQTFPEDIAMILYMAQAARLLQNFEIAFQSFEKVGKTKGEHQESALLSAIETAELAKNNAWLAQAYGAYLANSEKKERVAEVTYQSARMTYDKGDYAGSALALRDFALGKLGNLQLREQAANLALDALGLLKDDERLQVWSEEFAKAFPQNAKEKRDVGQKARLNQIAKLSAEGKLTEAWSVLVKDAFLQAEPADRIIYLKNKLALAEKLSKFSEARAAADELLALAQLSASDRQYTLERKVWLSELGLDFETALVTLQKLETSAKMPPERWLKLAMYADLATKDTKPFYIQYLKNSNDKDNKSLIAAQLVRAAPQPVKELENYKAILSTSPDLLALLYLEIYAKDRSQDTLKKALNQSTLASSKMWPMLKRQQYLTEFAALKKSVTSHGLDSSTQKKLGVTIKARVALLEKLEKATSSVVSSGDWTAQVLYLDLLSKENERFYSDIMGLPLPAGLTPEQETEYLQALSAQASPHQTKANDIKTKLNEFWSSEKALTQLLDSRKETSKQLRALVDFEISELRQIAPDQIKAKLDPESAAVATEVAVAGSASDRSLVENARLAVKQKPMDRATLENLLAVEEKFGRPSMVNYLKGRLAALDNGAKQEAQQ